MATKMVNTGITFPDGTTQATAATSAGLGVVGYSQTWQSVSRSLGTTYTNSTGRPIMVLITISVPSQNNSYVYFRINGTIVGGFGETSASQPAMISSHSFIIPAGATYSATTQVGSPSVWAWWELR
jgi:hypothetical protein